MHMQFKSFSTQLSDNREEVGRMGGKRGQNSSHG